MNNLKVDGIEYDVSLLSSKGQSLFSVLLECNKKLNESQVDAAIYKAAAVSIIEELKGHLTEDSIIKAAE